MKKSIIQNKLSESSPQEDLLQKIAGALGVPAEQFFVLSQQYVFYTDTDGIRWVLLKDSNRSPIVRKLSGDKSDQGPVDENIAAFLEHNSKNPAGIALLELISRLLAMHLHCGLRDQ